MLAKIAPATGAGAICLEREAHMSVFSSAFENAVALMFHAAWIALFRRPKRLMS